jgi:SAM-dependent methyltransferase
MSDHIQTLHWQGCSGTDDVIAYEITDLNQLIDRTIFRYVRCRSCGLIRLTNPPQDPGKYYPDTYHDFPDLEKIASMSHRRRCKIDTVLRFMQSGKLLEIGPSYGMFCYQAKEAGFDVRAIEMDQDCCNYLKDTIGIQVTLSAKPEQAMSNLEKHDVIALWHVIEHLPDPWAVLEAAAQNLNAGGILVLAAPNPEAWQFEKMAEKWPHLDAPRHVYLFPIALLTECCASLGLKLEFVTTTDAEAKGWNRFGWQRLLMNKVRGKWFQRLAFIVGFFVSIPLALFESHDPKGSAYTMVFRKE